MNIADLAGIGLPESVQGTEGTLGEAATALDRSNRDRSGDEKTTSGLVVSGCTPYCIPLS